VAIEPDSKMFFLSAIDNLRDPARNTKWRFLVPSNVFDATGIKVTNGLDFATGEEGTDDFALHVDNCNVPEIVTKTDHLNWMGFKSAFAVNADISADMNFTAKVLEDMRAYEAMLAWQQNTINTGILVDADGQDRMNKTGLPLGLGQHKDMKNATNLVLRNNSIKVELYNWQRGDVILRLNLINSMPTKVGGFNLEHSENAKLLNFDFGLHCDRWTLEFPSGYQTGLL